MINILKPETADAVLEAVAWAAAEKTPIEIVGHGSKQSVGRPVQAEYTLDLSALSGITLYEPDELVLSAYAGTPLAEIEKLLAENNQELAFEPMDMGALNGVASDRATIGGVLAANVCGPRRIKSGSARDHVLGIKAVSGRGEAYKSGGRVVKNVTGYDLSKGLAGSWGTLAVATEIIFKVLPRSETVETIMLRGLLDKDAVTLMCQAMGSRWEVSSAAHLPREAAERIPVSVISGADAAVTVLRLEGFGPSVAYRGDRLVEDLKPFGDVDRLDAELSAALWRAVRDVVPLHGERPLWRVSVAPTDGPAFVSALQDLDMRYFYDWSGGLVWVETDEAGDAGEKAIRAGVQTVGGHATLMRGSAALRTAIAPFQPQQPALAALSRRLKENFDPKGILNPGRMVAGV
ncbi:MAG TPA: glycolate oxidase subunit GlcE [Afifellaceae bacterium]|nr:glycolate oxidase subunit GlcE [Afifellaceae bacterium]